MNSTLSPKSKTSPLPVEEKVKPKLRMEDDPRFLTLLAGVAGSCLSQYEIYRRQKGMDYEGHDLIETLVDDEDEWRLGVLTNRVYFAATLLYKRLTKEDQSIETFNEKLANK
jgi:hypothetical protein